MFHALLHLHLDGALLLADIERHVAQAMGKEFAESYHERCNEQQCQRQSSIHGVHK